MGLLALPSEGGFSLVIPPDGDLYPINLRPDRPALTQMYEHLDCRHVDVVGLGPGLDMWLDDEGMLNHQVNPIATTIARLYGYTHQAYFGPVLLCSNNADGDSLDLTAEAFAGLVKRLRHAVPAAAGGTSPTPTD